MAEIYSFGTNLSMDTTQDTYYTLGGTGEGLYKEKGSKFLGFAFPVQTEEEIQENLDALRKQYHDARHYCYAFVLGTDGAQWRANDDGEPGHSAGDPILGQIRSHNLVNTLVVVIRYFGGTKLGVSGLINAYKTAAAEALDKAPILKKMVQKIYWLHFSYDDTAELMRFLHEEPVEQLDQQYDANTHLKIGVPFSYHETFEEKFALVRKGKLEEVE